MLRTRSDNNRRHRRRGANDRHRIRYISAVYCFKRRACNSYQRRRELVFCSETTGLVTSRARSPATSL